MIPTRILLYPQNTQAILVTGLEDVTTSQYLNAATVTATLKNQNGKADSVLQNIPLTYVSGSNGNYQGTVPSTFNAEFGAGYTLEVTAEQGGVQSFFSIPVLVQLRRQ